MRRWGEKVYKISDNQRFYVAFNPSKVVLFSQAPGVYDRGTGGKEVGLWWMVDSRRLDRGCVAEVSRSKFDMIVLVLDWVVWGGLVELVETSDSSGGMIWARRAEWNYGLDDRGSVYSIGFDFYNPIGLKLRRQSTLSSIIIENDGNRMKAPES